ncbi:MAG: icmP [Gammaproteobacteria bacterium]|jgi:intracellular multiplication protein IcmP|nr:icmP [Gammaproteobacteria bacterium]
MAGGAQQGSGGGGGKDNHMGFLWILFGLFILGWIIWYLFQPQLVRGFFYFKLAEISVISFFTDQLSSLRTWILTANPRTVTMGQIVVVSNAVGQFIRIPAALLLFILGALVYFTDIRLKFKRTYNMETLAEAERANWPQITPVVGLDLVNEDIDEGQWAMAMTPLQFVKKHKLIILHEATSRHQFKVHGLPPTMELVPNKANAVFAAQMGKAWMGIDSLSIHAKALFAVFAARIGRDAPGGRALLRQISASAHTGKLDFSGVEVLLAKHRDHKQVIQIIQSHAYELGVMASMLAVARDDGVLATAEFLWLKPLDRSLWYMLNSVGRRTAFCEIAGPFAHWLAEKAIGKKLRSPMVAEATRGLAIALETIIYTDEDYLPSPSILSIEGEEAENRLIEGQR